MSKAAARKKNIFILNVPVHIVIFHYSDVPGEWHAMCLETSAFGVGHGLREALEGLGKTLEGQYEELLTHGNPVPMLSEPDPEWKKAYQQGKHPAIDRVVILFRGSTKISIGIGSGTVHVDLPTELDLEPSLTETSLLHA